MTRTSSSAGLFALLLLVAGGGTAAWFVLAGESTSPEAIAPTGGRPAESTVSASTDAASDRLVAAEVDPTEAEAISGMRVIWPLELDLSLVQSGTFERVEGMLPVGSGASARLRGHIYGADGKGVAATVTFLGGPNEGRVLTCDATGGYGATDLYGGLGVVRIDAPGGRIAVREVRLRELAEEILTIGFGRPAVVYGAVYDKASQPIVGASVTMDGREALTDELGEFSFPQVASGKVLTVVRKPGFATYREIVPIMAGRTITKDRLSFRLEPGASLEVSIQEQIGAREHAQLFLVPTGGQRVNTRLGQRTYPWHLVNPVEVYPGGSALVEGLPEGRIDLMLFHSGALGKPSRVPVKLIAGGKRQVALHLEPAQQLRGTVVRAGEPVEGVRVFFEAPNRAMTTTRALQKGYEFTQQMILPHLPPALQSVRTDGRGRFLFTAFPASAKGYYVTAITADGLWRGNRVVRLDDQDVEVVLEATSEDRGRLRVELPGRYQGLPVEVRVQGSPREPLALAAAGELVVDDLEKGTWRVAASWNGQHILQGEMIEIAGESEASVELALPEGALHGQTELERERVGR